MGSVKTYNGTVVNLTPQKKRLGNVAAGINPTDAVNKAQLDALQQGTVDVTRIELASAGTAAAPAITWDGDTDTGIYQVTANEIGITTGGTQRATVTSAGIQVVAAVNVGTDITLTKEVNHGITVTATTTAATAGGNVTITAGAGSTSGNGGGSSLIGGAAGATGAGGTITVTSGAGGATSGASGAITIASGAATVGSSGTITITSGNTASGVAGDVSITTGTFTSTTVCPTITLNKAVVYKPASSSVASGATITGVELVKGLIAATGATGNWQLPSTADITTAIGSTPAGTNFLFVFNAAAMTAANTATLVVGANMSVASSPAITGGGTLTVTQGSQVTAGFRIVYDTATTTKIYRLW